MRCFIGYGATKVQSVSQQGQRLLDAFESLPITTVIFVKD
jgi:hypothetical protein